MAGYHKAPRGCRQVLGTQRHDLKPVEPERENFHELLEMICKVLCQQGFVQSCLARQEAEDDPDQRLLLSLHHSISYDVRFDQTSLASLHRLPAGRRSDSPSLIGDPIVTSQVGGTLFRIRL